MVQTFRHALTGLAHAVRTQRNARIHLAVTVVVIGVGVWLQLDLREWALLTLAAGLVWVSELLNTALEVLVDLASPDPHPLARVAKDISAAAVLIAALAAALVGLLTLGPHLLDRLG